MKVCTKSLIFCNVRNWQCNDNNISQVRHFDQQSLEHVCSSFLTMYKRSYNLCFDVILNQNIWRMTSLNCVKLNLKFKVLFLTSIMKQFTSSFFLWQILHTTQLIICYRKHVLETTTSQSLSDEVYPSYLSCTGNEENLRDCRQRGSCSTYYFRSSVVKLTCNSGEWFRCFNLSNKAYVVTIS